MKRLCIVILNYRRADLTIGCLKSLADEMAHQKDCTVVVVDNGSDDGSAATLEAAIRDNGWCWARLVASPTNGGFAAGNNLGLNAERAEAYMLLNSDARARAGSIAAMLELMDRHPDAGLIGPRLEDPDGTPQVSCFRYRTPASELLGAAGTGVLARLMRRFEVGMPVTDEPVEPQWLSFACVLIRREVLEEIGGLDESYFMYFEDIDFCRRAQQAGYVIRQDPDARFVHLRGGTSSVKSAIRSRARIPRYYYEARSRYFATYYGGTVGLWTANLAWMIGRSVAWLRELVGNKTPHVCAREWLDNWTNWGDPLRLPTLPQGGEL